MEQTQKLFAADEVKLRPTNNLQPPLPLLTENRLPFIGLLLVRKVTPAPSSLSFELFSKTTLPLPTFILKSLPLSNEFCLKLSSPSDCDCA